MTLGSSGLALCSIDCLAYVGLYLAVRGDSWSLRMASLKEMYPLLTAFDRLNYLKVLPQHFAEVLVCLRSLGTILRCVSEHSMLAAT